MNCIVLFDVIITVVFLCLVGLF